jgi:hypothetical protein
MSRANIAITTLALLLLATNALWAACVLRADEPTIVPSASARERTLYEQTLAHREEEAAVFAALEAAARPGATRAGILAAAAAARLGEGALCMDAPGIERVGRVGLRFDEAGRLTGATTTVCAP